MGNRAMGDGRKMELWGNGAVGHRGAELWGKQSCGGLGLWGKQGMGLWGKGGMGLWGKGCGAGGCGGMEL